MKYTKLGIKIISLLITCIMYSSIIHVFNNISQKVIEENEENKGKTLSFFIDR